MPDQNPADYIKARTDSAAGERYRSFLQRSLSTISDSAIWLLLRGQAGDAAGFVATTAPDAVQLKSERWGPILLRATQHFHYIDHPERPGERKVTTEDYVYTVSEAGGDNETELFGWHWHPSIQDWDYAHLHVFKGGDADADLHKLHIPTGRVAFEQVLLFLFDEGGVPHARDDADEVLDDCLGRFKRHRTWH